MEEEKQDFKYLIPANVSARFEFIEGFGFNELIKVVAVFLISLVIYYLLGMPKEMAYTDPYGSELINVTKEMILSGSAIEREIPKVRMIWRLLSVLIPTALTFTLIKKDGNGLSAIDFIKKFKKFKRAQKRYSYIYNSGSEGN